MNLNELFKVHVLAALGNPLVDVLVSLKDNSLLDKYNLKPDGQKEVNSKEFHDIVASLESEGYEVTCSPGGCAQNTLRIVQKLVMRNYFSVLFGSIGTDDKGRILETQLNNSGVHARYANYPSHTTGSVAALINGESRSLVAHLGAAELYSMEDFTTPENLKLMEEVYVIYVEGFFITHSFDVVLEAIRVCRSHGAVVVFNICGAYVADMCPEELLAVARAADIVIGNDNEFKSLACILGFESLPCEEIAVKLHCALWEKIEVGKFKLDQMGRFGKTLIVTRGKNPVICVCSDRKLVTCNVPYMDIKDIRDPTGAGDAFAAGFLVAFLQNRSILDCLSYGCAVAQEIIQHVGVNVCDWQFN